jgi:hypothetical protein
MFEARANVISSLEDRAWQDPAAVNGKKGNMHGKKAKHFHIEEGVFSSPAMRLSPTASAE